MSRRPIVIIPEKCVRSAAHGDIADVGIGSTYAEALERGGCAPLVVPKTESASVARTVVGMADGLLLPGGGDVEPSLYGEACHAETRNVNSARDRFEMLLLSEAIRGRKPVLGICRGMQVLNVLMGGTLVQDLTTETVCHMREDAKWAGVHDIRIDKSSRLHGMLGVERIKVNSTHHQAVGVVAHGLRAVAWADDGVVEAVEGEDMPIVGVQFHPERLLEEPFPRLFADFLKVWGPG